MPLNIPITVGKTKTDITNGTEVDCIACEDIKKNTFVYADNLLRFNYQTASAYGSFIANIDNNLFMTYYKSSYSSPTFNIYNTEKNTVVRATIDDTNALYDYTVNLVYLNGYLYSISTSQYNTGSMRFVTYKVDVDDDSATITKIDSKYIQISSKKISTHTTRVFGNKFAISFETDNTYIVFVSNDLEIISAYSSILSPYDYFSTEAYMYWITDTLFVMGIYSSNKASAVFGLFEIDSAYNVTLKYSYVYTDHHYGNYSSMDSLIQLHGRFLIFGQADITYYFTRFMLLEVKDDTITTHDEWTMNYASDKYAFPSIYTINDNTFLWIVLWRTTSSAGNYSYEMKKYVFSIDMDSNGKYRIYVVSHFDYDTSLDTSKNYAKFRYDQNWTYIDNSCLRAWSASGSNLTYCEIDLTPHIKHTTINMSSNVDPCIGISLEDITQNDTGKVSVIKGGFI